MVLLDWQQWCLANFSLPVKLTHPVMEWTIWPYNTHSNKEWEKEVREEASGSRQGEERGLHQHHYPLQCKITKEQDGQKLAMNTISLVLMLFHKTWLIPEILDPYVVEIEGFTRICTDRAVGEKQRCRDSVLLSMTSGLGIIQFGIWPATKTINCYVTVWGRCTCIGSL